MTFERQMDETRGATAQITCWCALIALHQEFGMGADPGLPGPSAGPAAAATQEEGVRTWKG